MSSSLTDRECVERCLDGRPDAYRHLVSRYQGPLLSYLVGRLGDPHQAEEAAQEAFVRAYFALRKLKKPDSFFAWLAGIAGRVMQEQYRARRRQVKLAGQAAEHRSAIGDAEEVELGKSVAALPDVYREVILMRYYAGLSCAELASRLGVPIGTVTKRLSRAYALLRKSLLPRETRSEHKVQP